MSGKIVAHYAGCSCDKCCMFHRRTLRDPSEMGRRLDASNPNLCFVMLRVCPVLAFLGSPTTSAFAPLLENKRTSRAPTLSSRFMSTHRWVQLAHHPAEIVALAQSGRTTHALKIAPWREENTS